MDNFKRRLESYFEMFKNEYGTSEGSIPIEQVIEFTAKGFKENHITTYEYTEKNIISFTSRDINVKMTENMNFARIVNYISVLFDYLVTGEKRNIDEDVLNEVDEWEIKGANCIYLSILLYLMLVTEELVCNDCMKFYQGFYRHDIRKDYPSFYPWAGQHNGLHSWITIQGSIIDIAIRQQERFFDFEGCPYVLGKFPEGLIYMGWEESKDTVFQYFINIVKSSKKGVKQWIAMHYKNSMRTFIDTHLKIHPNNSER